MTEQRLRKVAQRVSKHYELNGVPEIEITEDIRGWAFLKDFKITLPKSVLEETDAYGIYYVVHELAHHVLWQRHKNHGHGKDFQTIEEDGLRLYGITIERREKSEDGVYPARLFDKIGKLLWRYE
jgi:predicted SprT family Zn-dependent metalloprotease